MQGLETLAVRLPRHEANARAVAAFLASDPRVTSVSFLGLPDNPYHELARRYLGDRVPSIMTFTVRGGREAGIAVFNHVKLFKRLLNMGDAKSLITHPASTTHRQLTPDDLKLAGISPDMVRLSIGLEHPDDLIEDLDQALVRLTPADRRRAAPRAGSTNGAASPPSPPIRLIAATRRLSRYEQDQGAVGRYAADRHERLRRRYDQPLAHAGFRQDLRHAGAEILEGADPAPR